MLIMMEREDGCAAIAAVPSFGSDIEGRVDGLSKRGQQRKTDSPRSSPHLYNRREERNRCSRSGQVDRSRKVDAGRRITGT